MIDIIDNRFETLVRWYLRFNGYFTIENFIIHAGDDLDRITSQGIVGNYTETDVLGIRMPYSHEISGRLYIANHPPLVNGSEYRHDVVIGEAKSGKTNNPNLVWRRKNNLDAIEYLIRFIGLFPENQKIECVASKLLNNYLYDEQNIRFRYIIFAEEVNQEWQSRGVTYITYDEIFEFLVTVRGQSWVNANIGVASVHYQWDPLINQIFTIANDMNLSDVERIRRIKVLFNNSGATTA